MVRRILLGAFGCAALGLFACSESPDAEVVDAAPVVEQPILTAPEPADPTRPTEAGEPAIPDLRC